MRFRKKFEPVLKDMLRERGIIIPRYLSDEQKEALERNLEYRALSDVKCVVCCGEGKYVYNGQEYECPDDAYGHVAMRLARWYWLHNLPLQYQQLVWDEWPMDTPEHVQAKKVVDSYVDNFKSFRLSGVGITFHSTGLGTGKTWAATATLKRLLKQGYDGWFVPFGEVRGYYEIKDDQLREYLVRKLRESSVLVLDEVISPWSEASQRFFADKLEEFIRPRTNANLPTIITTNMSMDEIERVYPRVFSLLMMKNYTVELSGSDARTGEAIWRRVAEAPANGERLPID